MCNLKLKTKRELCPVVPSGRQFHAERVLVQKGTGKISLACFLKLNSSIMLSFTCKGGRKGRQGGKDLPSMAEQFRTCAALVRSCQGGGKGSGDGECMSFKRWDMRVARRVQIEKEQEEVRRIHGIHGR